MLGRRGFAVESVAASICREGEARVVTNMMIRDMDLAAPNPNDSRRLEIVADGLHLFGGAQLAVDTTLVSVLPHVAQGLAEGRDQAEVLRDCVFRHARQSPQGMPPGYISGNADCGQFTLHHGQLETMGMQKCSGALTPISTVRSVNAEADGQLLEPKSIESSEEWLALLGSGTLRQTLASR